MSLLIYTSNEWINMAIIRYDNSAKKIRNEVELIMLLYGNVLSYEEIKDKFEISQKTFKRDIEVIKIAVTSIFNDDAKEMNLRG